MREEMKVLYDFLSENQLEIEDIDIQLHVYTYPMTKDFLAYCKENQYVFKDIVANGPPEEFAHYDFTYNDIDSMEYVTNCTEETGFSVGTCAAAGFNFSIFAEKYLDNESVVTYDQVAFKGAIVLPVFDFYYKNSKITGLQIGVFHCRDYEEEDGIIRFTCLDNMYKLDKKAKKIEDYVEVPLKSKKLLSIMLEDILDLAVDSLGESDVKHFQVNKVTHLKKLTYRTIASYALELIAGYGFFNAYGEFCVKTFRASKEPILTISYDDVAECKKAGEGIKINGYSIQYEDRGVASFYYPAGEEEIENPIPLTVDNPLLYGKKQENIDIVGERMDKRMYGFTFTPYEVTTFIPDFRIQAGDFVNVEDKNGEIHKILVSQLTYRDNLEMEIISAFDSQEQESSFDSEVNEAIQRNQGIDDVILDTDDEAEKIVQFSFTGKEFNAAIKNLADDSYTKEYYDPDKTITGIEVTNVVPADGVVTKEFSDIGNGQVLTAYMDGTVVKLYTEADTIMFPEDSSYMFYNYRALTSLDLTSFDTGNVTTMESMFSDCESLKSLDLTSFDTGNVTTMESMFFGCNSLTSLDLSELNTGNVTTMESMFNCCFSLTSLGLSKLNTGNVTNMVGMFKCCNSLTSLDLASFDTGNVTTMESMFYDCESLKSLDLTSFDTGNVTTMESMFSDCESLKSLDLTSFDTGNVTTMESMFSDCESLKSLDLASFDTGNVTNMVGMFNRCISLTSLDLTSFDTGNVTTMGAMFYNCISLTSLDLTSFDTGNVTTMMNMFYNCRLLTSLDLTSFDTGNVTNMRNMFYDCRVLTNILVTLGKWITPSNNSYMFKNCGCSNVSYI